MLIWLECCQIKLLKYSSGINNNGMGHLFLIMIRIFLKRFSVSIWLVGTQYVILSSNNSSSTLASLLTELWRVQLRNEQAPTHGPEMAYVGGGCSCNFIFWRSLLLKMWSVASSVASESPESLLVQHLGSYHRSAELESAFYQNFMNIHVQD